jgi:hypothetical protein
MICGWDKTVRAESRPILYNRLNLGYNSRVQQCFTSIQMVRGSKETFSQLALGAPSPMAYSIKVIDGT